jgi:hypothetical protein
MKRHTDHGRQAREAEAARAKEREGFGTVPNAAPAEENPRLREIKEAAHELEEKEGDWSKGR